MQCGREQDKIERESRRRVAFLFVFDMLHGKGVPLVDKGSLKEEGI